MLVIGSGPLAISAAASPLNSVSSAGKPFLAAAGGLQSPTANAGGPYTGSVQTALTVTGSASSDPNGETLTYAWNFGDGTTATGVSPSHTYTAAGKFTITLIVTDTGGASATAKATATLYALPVANAGGPYTGTVGKSIAMSGNSSTWPSGPSRTYTWNFGDGTTGVGATPSHIYAAAGSYTVTLTATDSAGGIASASTTASVLAYPVMNAGGPYKGTVLVSMTMNATGSSDPNGLALTYAWNFGDGSSGTGVSPTHSYAAAGKYTVTVTGTDSGGASSSATTSATVYAQTVANPGGPYSGIAGVAIAMTGSASIIPSGAGSTYLWNFGDGTTSSAENPNHTYSALGTYTVTLTVTDNVGGSSTATTTAKVIGVPTAIAGGPYTGSVETALTVTGAASSDPNGQTLTYAWTFGDGATATGVSPSHTYATAGSYSITLTVTDTGGASATSKATATIYALPVANAGGPYTGMAGKPIAMNGNASTWPSGPARTYTWSFGDGSTGTGASLSHVYTAAGNYTVTLTLTDSAGGSATATTSANVLALPAVSAGGPYQGSVSTPVSMAAGTTNPSNLVLTYAWTFGDGGTGTGVSPTHTYAATGTYTVTVTATGTMSVSVSASTTATIYALPVANPGGPYTGTVGKSISMSGSASTWPSGPARTYTWNFGDGTTGVGISPSHIYNAAGSYTVTLTLTDTAGGSATASTTASVLAYPVVNAGGPYKGSVETPLALNGTATIDPNGQALIYAWSFGDGGSGTGVSPTHTYAAAGTYNITLTATDTSGLSASAKATATIYALPVANAGGPYSGIAGKAIAMSGGASTVPSGVGSSSLWSFGDGTTSAAANPSHTYTAPGSYTVTLTITDNVGGSSTATTTATVVGVPVANAGGPYTGSVQTPLTVTGAASSDPSGETLTYAWTFGDGTTATGVSPSHTYATAGSYAITLTVTDTSGLSATAKSTATIDVLPTANAGGPYSGLAGKPIAMNGSASTWPSGPARTYTWNFGDGSAGTGATPSHVYISAGVYTVTLTLTDSAGGSATATTTATVGGAPTANPGGPYTGIAGSAVSMTGAASTDPNGLVLTYAWNFGDGTTGTGATPSHIYAALGTYTVTLTVTDSGGASGSASTTAKILGLPTANAGGPYAGDAGSAISMTGAASTDPNGLGLTYAWNFGDSTTGTGATPSHTYAALGTYTVTLTVTDSGGASGSASTSVKILGLPTANAGGPYTGVAGLAVSMTGAASTDPNGLGLTYSWNFGDGSTGTGVTTTHIYSAAGTYTVTLTVTDSAGGSATAATTTAVGGVPTANPGGPYSGIAGQSVNMSGTGSTDPSGLALTYAWNFGDGTTGTGATPSHTYAALGTYTVALTVTDSGGASASASTTAKILGLPTANAGGPYTGVAGSAVTMNGAASTDPNGLGLTYAWTFGDGSAGIGATSSHSYVASGTYTVTLTVTDSGGAAASATSAAVIKSATQPPIVNPGGPYVGQAGTAVSFSSSGTSDQNGLTLSYVWNFGDGTTGVGSAPTHAYTNSGTYVVTLTASDNAPSTASATTSATISAAPQPPIANAGGPYTGTAYSPVAFFGANSSDPSNPLNSAFSLSYAWSFGDGGFGAGPTPTHTYTAAGTYTVSLTVKNPAGATGTATTSATIAAGTPPSGQPTANPGGPYNGSVNSAISFNGASSSDPNNLALTYLWNFGDATTATTAVASHTYTQAGTYSISLTVNNGTSQSTAGTTATVTGTNPSPIVANAGGPYTVAVNQPLQLNGTGSTNPNNRQLTYVWSFGDGSVGAGSSPTHIYTQMGSYTIGLTVSDGASTPGSTTTSVTVNSPAAETVNASIAGPYQSVVGQAVVFDATASSDNLSNPLTFAWDFGDGTTGTGVTPSHTYTAPGSYTATVTATGASANATATTAVTIGVSIGVTITSPTSNALFGVNSIQVTGTVTGPNLAVTVNGVAATVSGTSFVAKGVSLREGVNLVSATATDGNGGAGTGAVSVILDVSPPAVSITSPTANATVTSSSISVAGLVNDLVTGTVGSNDVTVTVNGIAAQVQNRSYLLPNLQLAPGTNTITVVATDNVGNTNSATETVLVLPANLQLSLVKIAGDSQTGAVGTVLPQPLVVQLVASDGTPVPGRPITFTVSRSDGQVEIAPTVAQSLYVNTDANGRASVLFQLGSRSGLGINQVSATTPGAAAPGLFTETSTIGAPTQIHIVRGQSQRGLLGEPLAEGLQVLVQDATGNPVPGVTVNFTLTGASDGVLDNPAPVTDSNGKATANLTLGQQEGTSNYSVTADFQGDTGLDVTFNASAFAPGPVAATSVSGVVLDNSNVPVQGATVTLPTAGLSTTTDVNGRFQISGAPVGTVPITVDGSTAISSETLPFLSFVLEDLPGQNNTVDKPIFLPAIDANNAQTVGGNDPVTLTMAGVPGLSFTIAPNSVTFPDGSTVGMMSLSQVKADMVPMEPTSGQAPGLVWTLQPAGTRFSVPVQVTLPNTNQLPPGYVTEIYQYDHDLEQFVSAGTAHVSADGSVIVSDPGFGITKAGWGHPGAPPLPVECAGSCPQSVCVSMVRPKGTCQCIKTYNVGATCGTDPVMDQCRLQGVCGANGHCLTNDKPDGIPCTPSLFCQRPGKCTSGACVGTPVPEVDDPSQTAALANGIDISRTFQPIDDALKNWATNTLKVALPIQFVISPVKGTNTLICCEATQQLNVPKSTWTWGQVGFQINSPQILIPSLSLYVPGLGNEGAYLQVGASVIGGVTNTSDECAMKTCWSGGLTASGTITVGLAAGVTGAATANVNISGGLQGSYSVNCTAITGSLGSTDIKATASLSFAWGSSISISKVIYPAQTFGSFTQPF